MRSICMQWNPDATVRQRDNMRVCHQQHPGRELQLYAARELINTEAVLGAESLRYLFESGGTVTTQIFRPASAE